MRIFRIADRRHPLWDGSGAMRVGGRWNSPGQPVIYGATTYAGAMLEMLVHTRIGKVPTSHVWIVAQVPAAVSIEIATVAMLPVDWDAQESQSARAFGDRWLRELRTAVLLVPSVITGDDGNVMVNPAHPDAVNISVSEPHVVAWDTRLFE